MFWDWHLRHPQSVEEIMSETLRNNWILNGTSSTESRMDDCAPLVISKEWSHIDDHTKPSVWECTARVGPWELKNNCCCLPCKQDPSSDHTGKDPSEDRNGNCRWTGRIPTRQGDKRSNHESHNKTETALGGSIAADVGKLGVALAVALKKILVFGC